MSDEEYKGNGYCGISMSNNAVAAYAEGKKPLSKWKKKDIIDELKCRNVSKEFMEGLSKIKLGVLKKYLLHKNEWHHTSLRYNITFFYELRNISPDQETDLLQKMKEENAIEKKKDATEREKTKKQRLRRRFWLVEMEYTERNATGKHSWTTFGEGVIDEKWCYLKNGRKKSRTGKNFKITAVKKNFLKIFY